MTGRSYILRLFVGVAVALLYSSDVWAVVWKNIDNDHYLGGRKCSSGYLLGKVVLVCQDESQAKRMEDVWTGFKTKPFVLIGSYSTFPKEASHPVYQGVALEGKTPVSPLYVVDALSRVRYRGSDEHRATEAIVSLLTDVEAPKSDAQWRQFLDYEFAVLPGQAYLRYLDYKKAFPASAKDYAEKFSELSKDPDVKRLAELVKFSKSVKDLRSLDPKKAQQVKSRLKGKIEDVVEKFASLKEAARPSVVQEAKNALADLAWVKAGL